MFTSSVPKLQRHKSAHGRLQSSASVAPAGTDARHETQGERPSVGKPGRSRRAKSARETRTLERGSSQELAKSGGWGSTQYGDDFGPKEPVTPVPVRPISPTRRNNPHPAMVSRSSYSISAQLAARLDSSPAHLLLFSTNLITPFAVRVMQAILLCIYVQPFLQWKLPVRIHPHKKSLQPPEEAWKYISEGFYEDYTDPQNSKIYCTAKCKIDACVLFSW